ncbi:SART-1 family protein DOT2 [Vitis vinifera]|uniref:SART-1 family protein DOT2 n=1 Tax=Vitis vinifera TaxID=29760 RepID=A0A438DC77_VITVI|nr:SART-1 family protein DOT2 [Vitis vinifera]
MMEDSPYESFEPLDLPHVSTHGDEEPVSSSVPASVTHNFHSFLRCIQGKRPFQNKSRFKNPTQTLGMKSRQGDHTLFIKHSATGGVTALLVYVDDIIVTGNDEREKHEVKQRLATEFEIKELGKLKYFFRLGVKPVSIPKDPNHKLGEAKEEPMVDKRMYQRLVGRLIYLAHTRPDIAYSVSVISQFMHDPREPHLQTAYKVLHYLKGNPGKGILFKKNNTLALEAYTDADCVGSLGGSKINYRVLYFSWRKYDDPKEAFRMISHKFHGKGPGKMKQEKRMKQYQEELKLKQMKNSDTHHSLQTSDPRSGFATVEKDVPGSLTPMLGDRKVSLLFIVEHFLGIKRKAEPSNMGPPKKPKT